MQGFIANPISVRNDKDDQYDDDEFSEDMIDDPRCPVILLSKEEKRRLRQPWKHASIIKMFDSKIGHMSLMKRLKRSGNLQGVLLSRILIMNILLLDFHVWMAITTCSHKGLGC